MKPRKHQYEFSQVIEDIQTGATINEIILAVTPGGGKSFIPIVAGKLIESGHADALAWIVPRQALQDQGEREFIDPFSRELFNHNLIIRSSTNQINPCRGTNGFVTTYQALGVDDKKTVAQEFSTKRYILILDEYHHIEDGGLWHNALESLYNLAKYKVLMTGTLERGDQNPIAFTKYVNNKPVLESDEKTAVIKYTRRDALEENAILPISFHLSDGRFTWQNQDGVTRAIESFEETEKNEDSAALYTALKTDFATQLLQECTNHWRTTKKQNPGAKMLVVTAEYEQAKEVTLILKRATGMNAEIATSHNAKHACHAIKHFKSDTIDVLVTIAMAYEGLSVPPVTHICCLTHIRSSPWLEQMIARGVRIDKAAGPYKSQRCHVFAPSDKLFIAVMDRIKKEQIASIMNQSKPEESEFERGFVPGGGDGSIGPNILPLGSELTGQTEHFLGDDGNYKNDLPLIETISEQESRLRREIQKYVNFYTYENNLKPKTINFEIKRKFKKARKNMSLSELERLFSYIKKAYKTEFRPSSIQKRPRVDPKPQILEPIDGDTVKYNLYKGSYF